MHWVSEDNTKETPIPATSRMQAWIDLLKKCANNEQRDEALMGRIVMHDPDRPGWPNANEGFCDAFRDKERHFSNMERLATLTAPQ